jgi:hypothetical protein
MSHLHSESTNQHLGLTVRVKVLDLNQALAGNQRTSRSDYSGERLGAALLSHGGARRSGPVDQVDVSECEESLPAEPRSEICMHSQEKIAADAFEEHIELCCSCCNRVELQLDFMECLETAVYQRLSDPESRKIHGALMVSAPEFNFAICGELEII